MPDAQAAGQARRPGVALSRWENEGGKVARSAYPGSAADAAQPQVPHLSDAELVQLRVRVVALENLVITLLAQTNPRRLDLAREMASYISPRPGFTLHPLTLHAAAQMIHLVERAGHFRRVLP